MVVDRFAGVRYSGTLSWCILNSMFSRILAFIGIGALLVLGYIINATTPAQAGAVGVLVVFLSFYAVSTAVATFVIYLLNRLIVQLFFADVAKYKTGKLSFKKSYYYGSVFALGPVVLISLQSVGSGGLGSFLLVCTLLILGSVYVARQTV